MSREEVCRIVYCLDRIAWIRRESPLSMPGAEGRKMLKGDLDHMRRELDVISRHLKTDEERIAYVLMDRLKRDRFLIDRKIQIEQHGKIHLDKHGAPGIYPVGDEDTDSGLNAYAMMALLTAFTGLRFEEVAALRRRHAMTDSVAVVEALTEVAGKLSIGPTKTKGSRRAVPIASRLVIGAFLRYARGRGPDDLLFTGRDGGMMSRTRYRARFWVRPCGSQASPRRRGSMT